MKKIWLLVLALLFIGVTAVSADDIWEPEPAELNAVTLSDLFSWGDDIEYVHQVLRDYDYFFTKIERFEDAGNPVIIYSGENGYGQFAYSFLFTKEGGKLWKTQTIDIYMMGSSGEKEFDSICKEMGVDELEPYDRAVIDDILPAEDLEKLFAAADETTIYWGGYDSNNRYSEQGDTVFFTRIDRENYEAEMDS